MRIDPADEAEDRGEGVGGGDLIVPQVQGVQKAVVGAHGLDDGLDSFGEALAQVFVAFDEGLLDGEALGQAPSARQLDSGAAVDLGGSGDQPGVFPGGVVQGDVFQGLGDAGGQGPHGGEVVFLI